MNAPSLNLLLLSLADQHENVTINFNHKCLDVDLKTASAIFENKSGEEVEVKSDRIIGADGTFSAIRAKMMRQDRFQYSQKFIEHGFKELTIPANDDGVKSVQFILDNFKKVLITNDEKSLNLFI